MQPIDWFLFSIPIAVIAVFCFHSQKYIRSVADFLAAGRTGGRYLLSSANGMAGMGLITLAVAMQNFRHAGWAVSWWGQVITLAMTILSLSGFVYYRYRQTKVLTLAQFFEIRYCRAFRVVMGILCWLAGIINFGIFPAVGAHFFIAFLGLPREIGGIPLYPVLMVLFLGSAAVITMSGGQVQNMITDMIQSLFGYFMCVVVGISVVCIFSMEQFREAMLAQPPGQSYVNPFDSFEVSDFNIWFILINLIVMVYGYGSWQGNQGYSASALNPHEAKMGNILSTWRMLSITMFSAMISLGAYTFLTHPAFASEQLAISGELASYSAQNADQMAMPMATSSFLPAGIKGLFAAVAFFFMLSTDTTYLHSWGSIFIQDIVLPLYGRPVSARLHLLLLRLAILGVAVFGFVFSLCYRQNEYINMFQMITGTFFSAGAGCAIIGGLYWKRGTRAGAWSGVAAGAFLSLAGIVLMDAARLARGAAVPARHLPELNRSAGSGGQMPGQRRLAESRRRALRRERLCPRLAPDLPQAVQHGQDAAPRQVRRSRHRAPRRKRPEDRLVQTAVPRLRRGVHAARQDRFGLRLQLDGVLDGLLRGHHALQHHRIRTSRRRIQAVGRRHVVQLDDVLPDGSRRSGAGHGGLDDLGRHPRPARNVPPAERADPFAGRRICPRAPQR